MPYKENLSKATELKAELDSFRPLPPETEKRIMQKFRLDWNYNSSHIEGNQLTYGETKALILFGQTAQAKPLKDHLEMTGHDEAVKVIEEIVKQERPLTESFIRELHTLILKETYDRPAQTPEGISTVRRIAVGQYKTSPNHVLTKTGEMFYFASPEETPAKMEELMKWYNENLNNDETHPVLFATEFHYKFIRIHPFDDGNGRMARLLMNLILMQKGYPPAIIKSEDKEEYYNALQQADAGQIEYFFNYLCIQVIRSLDLMIKGAKGENVDEDEDLDKKLALLKQRLDGIDEQDVIKLKFNRTTFLEMYQNWIKDLIKDFISTTQKYNEFYLESYHSINFSCLPIGLTFSNESVDEILSQYAYIIDKNAFTNNSHDNKLRLRASFISFKKAGINTFDCSCEIEITFGKVDYSVYFKGHKTGKRLLNVPFEETERKYLIKILGEYLLGEIENNISKGKS